MSQRKQQLASILKKNPVLREVAKRSRGGRAKLGAIRSSICSVSFLEILSRLGLLQQYARIRRLKVARTLYTEEYYLGRDGCEGFDEFRQYQGEKLAPRLARVLAEIREVSGKSFLDLGCGRGEMLLQLERRGARRIIGVDYSAAAVEIARGIVTRADLACADVSEFLPQLPSLSFDGVLMIDIVEHMFDWELTRVFGQVSRVLAPDGVLYVDTPLASECAYSNMHVNVKKEASDLLRFLPGFAIEKVLCTDSRGNNHLIIMRRRSGIPCS